MRTVLISIPDNAQAEQIVKELGQRLGLDPYGRGEDGDGDLTDEEFVSLLIASGLTLDAMVARPTKWCTCGGTKGAGSRTTGYAQSERYHWWVHRARKGKPRCNKPTRFIVDHWIRNMLNGARDILGEVIPSHKEEVDHLDRGARFRVRKQYQREELQELARQR